MDWRRSRQSDNVVRGGGVGRMGGVGLGGAAVVVLVGLALGRSPVEILGFLLNMNEGQVQSGQQTRPTSPEEGEQVEFVRAILGSTEDTWGEVFDAAGKTYPAPRLVLFAGAVESACGRASASVGPFYCPGDAQVYLDLEFFRLMDEHFHAAGDLARAYVIAHEVGHHLQNVMGVMEQVDGARRRGAAMEGDTGLSVRQELQADCFAGVWAKRSEQRLRWLEEGDIEGALAAATAIGDDALQRKAGGAVVPDSFTHGSSQQRVRWFKTGLSGGELTSCDTFRAAQL